MIREDIITQMVKQIAALIARLLKRNISAESMEAELDGLAGKWIGLPSDLLLSLPPEDAFRLLEDSNRMVVEKSYLMGEMYRLKGIKTESPSAKEDFFAKALFFYDKCSGKVSKKLQQTIDQTIEELRVSGKIEQYSAPAKKLGASHEVRKLETIPTSTNKQKKRTSTALWYAIAVCVFAIGVHSFFDENEIAITNHKSEFEDGLAQTEFQIVNNTDQERLIRLRLSVEHSSRETFGSSNHTFLGSVEKEYTVAPQSKQKIIEEFECATKAQRANQTIAIAMLSNKSVDTTPVSATH